ncbi:MAG: hypothetical protein ACR2JC_08770 [Chloroflexota bacterium]
MSLVTAVILAGICAASLAAYTGTPHFGPTATCGPITAFNQSFSIAADCRIISFVELAVALFCFMVAVFLALSARPHRQETQ